MIPPLQPPDLFHLQAAQGWLELGNPAEAQAELGKLTPALQAHPEALKVQWGIWAAQRQWAAAVKTADQLVEVEPEDPLGWVNRSYALHELKRTLEARDNLLGVVEKFPVSATMRYNLACYECQLGNLGQAKQWLQKAFRLGSRDQMKAAALQDPDLQPLWQGIRAG